MTSKSFLLQRIHVFAKEEFDPNSDEQAEDILRRKFSVYLPQRQSFDDRLANTICDHEIITLIREYRAMA
tara:strand:+ start:144 stop:353 length:210 start_codon:yes stop_codon:yes gene_type:complete